jgi:carbon-monoxide dehydrogenase medium subunit
MRLPPFELHRPATAAEASALLRQLGDDAAAYHGGSELLLAMKLGVAHYPHLVDLKKVAGLRQIRREGDRVVVGAGSTHRDVETSPEVRAAIPSMGEMAAGVANVRVRSVGTIGGNLCFADPHSDPATFLLALGARLVLSDGEQQRRLPVDEFVLGAYETALQPGELLLAVEVPLPPPGSGISHLRLRLHERPAVTVTAYVERAGGTVATARVAVGSVAGAPSLVDGLATWLGDAPLGASPPAPALHRCAAQVAAAVTPLDDGEGSVEYKTALVEVLTRRALAAALDRAAGE